MSKTTLPTAKDPTDFGLVDLKNVPPDGPPEDGLRVGDKVFVCYRGSTQLYPAWVTNLREQGSRGQYKLTLTMLWDKGTGCALVHDPVHQSQRRGATRESWWVLPEDAESI